MQVIKDNITLILEIIAFASPLILPTLIWVYNHVKKVRNGLKILNQLYLEFQPNHGSSACDKLNRIENLLINQSQKSQLLLSIYPEGMYECDANGSCIWSNKACQKIFGLTENELLGKGWLLCIAKKDRIEEWDFWKKCINDNIPYEIEHIIYNKILDKYFLVQTLANPITNLEGIIVGYFGIVKIIKEVTINESGLHSI